MSKEHHRDDRSGNNWLMLSLSLSEQDTLLSKAETVSLTRGRVLYEQGSIVPYVYFPQSAVVSLLTMLENGSSVEVATVGREGVIGVSHYSEAERAIMTAIVQVPGKAIQIDARHFSARLLNDRFELMLRRHTRALMWQITRSAGCNRFHSLKQRCARWFLSVHDRAGKSDLPLTQEFLSSMLGASRQATGLIIESLEKEQLIQTSRGTLKIIDRKGLELLACECYRAVKEELDALLPQLPT